MQTPMGFSADIDSTIDASYDFDRPNLQRNAFGTPNTPQGQSVGRNAVRGDLHSSPLVPTARFLETSRPASGGFHPTSSAAPGTLRNSVRREERLIFYAKKVGVLEAMKNITLPDVEKIHPNQCGTLTKTAWVSCLN